MFKKIMKCDYVFDSPWWDDVSDNAKARSLVNRSLDHSVKVLSHRIRHGCFRRHASPLSHPYRAVRDGCGVKEH